jgi:hypothetical protein
MVKREYPNTPIIFGQAWIGRHTVQYFEHIVTMEVRWKRQNSRTKLLMVMQSRILLTCSFFLTTFSGILVHSHRLVITLNILINQFKLKHLDRLHSKTQTLQFEAK